MNPSSSHHTTGNFGSNVSHQMGAHQSLDPRINKNYSQLSQHSNGSNLREFNQNQYMHQLLASEHNQMKQSQQMKLGQTAGHMKQVHSLGGPILSQYAGNQTIASNGNSQHSNLT